MDSINQQVQEKAMPDSHGLIREKMTGMENHDLSRKCSQEGLHVTMAQKPFTALSAMALGFNITNTSIALMFVLGSNTIFGAGPLFFYGSVVVALAVFCVTVSLAELASAYPHAGGQYFWVAQLSPPRAKRFLSYMTAIVSWASFATSQASCAYAIVNVTFQLVALANPGLRYQRWMGFLMFQGLNVVSASLSLNEHLLPRFSRFFLVTTFCTTITTIICLLAAPGEKQSAANVFGAGPYFNLSGWPNGMAFLIGINGPNWGFGLIDAALHLAEEIPNPRKNLPKALYYTYGIACVAALVTTLAMFFAATNLPETTSIIALLTYKYNNPIPAYVIGTLINVVSLNIMASTHSLLARIIWALSRDKGVPFSKYISKIAPPPYGTPIWAIFWGIFWVGLCGFVYLASATAFNSFVAAGLVCSYLTYALPVALLLLKGRKNFKFGPVCWPRFGPVANVVVIVWSCYTVVIYCLPYYLPVEAGTMNYLSVVMVIILGYSSAYWIFYGRRHYEVSAFYSDVLV